MLSIMSVAPKLELIKPCPECLRMLHHVSHGNFMEKLTHTKKRHLKRSASSFREYRSYAVYIDAVVKVNILNTKMLSNLLLQILTWTSFTPPINHPFLR